MAKNETLERSRKPAPSHTTDQEETYKNFQGEEREKAVMREMAPFAIYAALPILLTIFIAYTFGTR